MVFKKVWSVLRSFGIGGEEKQIDDVSQLIRLGRDEYKYVESGKSVILQIDMGTEEPRRIIYSSTIERWEPPHADEEITEAERRRIAKKIADFFERRRISSIVK